MKRALLTAGVSAIMQFQVSAWASGFAIREQSASFLGLSFAGVAAGGHDISTMFFNPATLTRHDGEVVHVSASYVLPTATFDLARARDGAGAPLSGAGGNIADDAVVPAVYAALGGEAWSFGTGMTAPFGLRTDAPDDWAGRYYATETELATVNVNPVLAYDVSERLTVAIGAVAQYADATLANARSTPLGDARAEVTGDDWDYGFTLGLLTEPRPGTRIGLGYRSQVNHTLKGEFEATAMADGSRLQRETGRAALATPQVASLGVRQHVSGRLDVLGTLEWTGWSSFDELRIGLGNGDQIVTEERWHDTWFAALGVEYRPRPDLALTAGAAFDQSPIDDRFRTPRIPGNDRTWLSVGAAWTLRERLTIGAGYSRIFVADGDVALDDPTRGELRGSFDNGVDILAVHGTLRF